MPPEIGLLQVVVALVALAALRWVTGRYALTRPVKNVAGLLFLALLCWAVEGPLLAVLPADLAAVAKPYWRVLLLSLLAFAVIRFAGWISYDLLYVRRGGREATHILKDLSTAVLLVIAVLVITREVLNFNLTSLIATSAVVTVILGLALQETLANLLAGLSLQVERPFAPGEWISVGDREGQVGEMNWRSTKLRTLGNDEVTIPNSIVAKSVVINYNRPDLRHELTCELGAAVQIPPNRVKDAFLEALGDDPEIVTNPAPLVRIIGYDELGVRYQARFMITDYPRYKPIRDRVWTRAWYHLRRAGVTPAVPARQVELRSAPEAEAEIERTRKRITTALAGVHFLAPLSSQELATLASRVPLVTFCRQETVIRQHDAGDSCFIILDGTAEVVVATPDGPRQVATLTTGQVFGEMSLITGEERTATVRALSDLETIVIGKDGFAGILGANPGIAGEMSTILAGRQVELERTLEAASEEARREALEREASHILNRIRRFFTS